MTNEQIEAIKLGALHIAEREVDALAAENAKLREALAAIVECADYAERALASSQRPVDMGNLQAWRDAASQARAALEVTK